MRTRAFIVIAVAALALAGCGNHNLVLKVDVLSYLDDSQKVIHVVQVPPVGDGGAIPIVSDMTISMIDGLDEAAKVKSVALSLGGGVTVGSGSGHGKFKLYLSDENTDPLTTQPVMGALVQFSVASPGIVAASGPDPAASPAEQQRVAKLFTQKNLHLAVVLDEVTIDSPGVTNMTVTITKLEAVVIAGRKNTFKRRDSHAPRPSRTTRPGTRKAPGRGLGTSRRSVAYAQAVVAARRTCSWPPSVMAMIEPASIARSRSNSSKASPSRLLLRLSTPHAWSL